MFCRKQVDLEHKCYILTEEKENSKKNNAGFIFFDYEAMQTGSNHEVNLVCVTRKCVNCVNELECEDTECRDFVFSTNDEFCLWLFNSKNKNFIAFAHNMRSYDGYFILNYIVSNVLPLHNLVEYPKNCIKSRTPQNIPKPSEIPERFDPNVTIWAWNAARANWEIRSRNTTYVRNPENLTEWIETANKVISTVNMLSHKC
jgi:hypothetical protein